MNDLRIHAVPQILPRLAQDLSGGPSYLGMLRCGFDQLGPAERKIQALQDAHSKDSAVRRLAEQMVLRLNREAASEVSIDGSDEVIRHCDRADAMGQTDRRPAACTRDYFTHGRSACIEVIREMAQDAFLDAVQHKMLPLRPRPWVLVEDCSPHRPGSR